jgi:hypothetical protein
MKIMKLFLLGLTVGCPMWEQLSDRLYRALYAALLSPQLPRASKPQMFLGLLFKAMKADVRDARVAAFAKRLLQARGCSKLVKKRTSSGG